MTKSVGYFVFLIAVVGMETVAFGQTVTTLHSFDGGTNGSYPSFGMVYLSGGGFYGTAAGGATDSGVLYNLQPPATPGGKWKERTLYTFRRGTEGGYPFAQLTIGKNGVLYGTTEAGGYFNHGTVFSLTPPANGVGAWAHSVIYAFQGEADGRFPQSPLLFDKDGAIYGATNQGGGKAIHCGAGCGVVFKLIPPASGSGPWTETVLYRFQGHEDGNYPGGVTFDSQGALYGMTNLGGSLNFGTIYKLTPNGSGDWIFSVLYNFETGDSFAGYPQAPLTFGKDKALYGPRQKGGKSALGMIFRLVPTADGSSWTFDEIHDCLGGIGDCDSPLDTVVLDDAGAVYGVSLTGYGDIFKLTPPAQVGESWTASNLYLFSGPDGSFPTGRVLFDNHGVIYGVTSGGGNADLGTIFKLQP